MKQKILYLCIAAGIFCSSSGMAATNSTLYTDTFENYTNGMPLIDGTNYWHSSSWVDTNGVTFVAAVLSDTNAAAAGSTNVATIPLDVSLSNRYQAATSTNVWLSMQTKVVRSDGSTNVVYDTNSSAIFFVDSNGYCVVFNGTNGRTTITKTLSGQDADRISTNAFTTIDVYLDYTNKTWRLNVNSVPFTNNIGFFNTNNTSLSNSAIYNSGFNTTYLDNVTVYDADMLPRLSLSPNALTNTSVYLTPATSRSFEVRSSGDGRLDYHIITNDLTWAGRSPWARITNAASGTLTNNATNTVWIQHDTASMPPGTYYNSFSVLATNYEGQSNNFQLTLNILGMSVSTNSLASSRMLGYAADTQSFNVFQTGDGAINYAIRTNPAASWLSVSPGTNTLSTGLTNTHYISYFTNSLTVGTSMTTIEVASADSGGVTQFITVAMTTYSRPAPKTSFTNYSQTIHKGQTPASTNMGIWNAGAAPMPRMNYAVTSDVSWLTVSSTSGTTTTNETNSITASFAADMTNYSGLYTGHLTVRGTDAGPSSSYTPTGQVTVSTQVTVSVLIYAPGKPGSLAATKGTSTDNVQLTWNTSTNLDHFELWRGTNSDVTYATRVDSIASSTTSYTDTGIMPGIINYYWVRIINAYGGAGAYSDSDTGWRYLVAPTGLTASDGLYTNRVALSWTASYGAQTYEIWRSEINQTNTASLVNTVLSSLTSYDDISATVETIYYYWVKSRTPYMGTFSDPDSGYRAALMQPTGVIASDGEFTNKVRVIWQAVDKASSYEVWRYTSNDRSQATKIGDSTASGYDDESATQGAYFYYWIRALNYEGYSRYSDSDYGWRQLCQPTGIAVSRGTYPYRIRVSWNPSDNAAGYEVWRGQGTGIGAGANVNASKIVDIANPYYDDHAVVASMPYYYRVKAISALGGASDYSSSDYGWREIAAATTTRPVKNDYDGDHLSDLTLYDSSSGAWKILCSIIGEYTLTLGDSNSRGVQGDYDGDGISDPMTYWSDQGAWIVMLSSIGFYPTITGSFGGDGANAEPADYDGDGMTDLVVYNESASILSVLFSNRGGFNIPLSIRFGGPGWSLVSADYDGDRKADPAVYSASTGLIALLSASDYAIVPVAIGGPGITMHPADYDGDRLADLVTYEESTGTWIAGLSTLGYMPIPFTMGGSGSGYRPIVADYDGDTLTDPAVYNESTGAWRIMFSHSGYTVIEDTYGGTNWVPVGR